MKSHLPRLSRFLPARFLAACAILGAGCSAAFSGAGFSDAGPAPNLDAGASLGDSAARDSGFSGSDAGFFSDASALDASAPAAECGAGLCDPRLGAAECLESATCAVLDASASCVESSEVGDVALGGACLTSLDCTSGLGCFSDRFGVLECLPFCCTDDDCGREKYCDTHSGTEANYGSCRARRPCTLLEPLGCGGDNGCYIVSATGNTECRTAGTAELGDECIDAEDCSEGLFCGGLLARACLQLCHLESDECGGAMSCVAYSYTPSGFGVCTAR